MFKRIFVLFLSLTVFLGAALPAFAADAYQDFVHIGGLRAPRPGEAPYESAEVSDGTLAYVEWYAVGDRKTEMQAGEVFEAGVKYSLYLYLDPPEGLKWKPLISGDRVYGDISVVDITASDTAGKDVPVTGSAIWLGQLMVEVQFVCSGAPASVPEEEPDPAPGEEPAAPALHFSDVAGGWYEPWVYEAAALGLINGKGRDAAGNDIFDPDGNMTFAEAVKLAACMHQLYTDGEITLENGDPWYKSYADYCGEKGILAAASGDGVISAADVMNRASEHVTRREFAWIFARSLPNGALLGRNTIPAGSIPDVKDASSAWGGPIYTLYRAGILNGSDAKGTFGPETNIQRSAVAAIVVRMMKPETRVGAPAELGQ